MTHAILLWWVGLCAKWKSLFPPGASESLDSHQPGLSWWHRHIRGQSCRLNTLGIPLRKRNCTPTSASSRISQRGGPSSWPVWKWARPDVSCSRTAGIGCRVSPTLPAPALLLICQPAASHYPEELSTETQPSLVLASCSPSWQPTDPTQGLWLRGWNGSHV